MNCETVKIVADNEQGYIVINVSDLQESDLVYVEGQASKPTTAKKGKS